MGIYSFFEDKWYSAIDIVDKVIPIGKTVDKVDEKVPSFILFLALILIVILLLLFTIVLPLSQGIEYDVEVVVLSNGLPLSGAKVEFFNCQDEDGRILTNSSGVAEFSVCEKEANVRVTKQGYNGVSKDFEPNSKRLVVTLSPQAKEEKTFTLLVKNNSKEIITDASVELFCDNILNKTKNNQSENGFRFDFEFDCVFPQVKVKAAGYEEKTVTILDGEERKVIYLDEIIQKGTIIFNTTNPDGIEANVEIILTDELGKASTYFTDYSGNKDYEIEAGEYEYSALSENSGEVITGDFEILGGERKTVNIAFTKTQDQINASDKKYFAFKVIDETAKPILFAKVRLYENGKSITFRDTRPNGKTNPITKTDFDESISYKAIVTSNGHALKIVDIVLQEKDAFQEIILNKGGSKINLTVVNDLYESEKDAFVTLNIAGFNASIYTGNTDRNGQISFENLSNGIFNLKASDKSKKDDATLDVVLGTNQTKDIQMVLTTGEGKIRFDFVDNKYNDIDTKYAFRDYNGTIINEGFSTRGYFRSNDLKKGTIVNLISNDSNYFYHQTLDYTISRTDQKKDVFIRKLDSLPNDQEIQMFLMQIYNSNPLYGKVSKASRIEQDQEYYLYFDLIIDNEEKNTVLANFEIENDSNKGITIEDVYSINPSQRVLSSIRGEQVIDKQNNQYLVDAAALQANLIVDEQQGKKSIPIILKIKVDINAEIESKSTIYFNSIHGTKNSLNYSKEIIIGEKFCLDDCPVFLFNNYLKWNDREYEVLYDDVSKRMLIDDDYTLKTTVTNKSDEDIGASKLVLTVPKEKMNYLKVEDTNTKSYDISLEALATSTSKETKITPLKKTNSGTLFEKVTKEENGIDQLLGYVGNNNSIRFKILEKEEIDISISPTSMSEGSRQFFFVIKTKYKSKYTGIPAHWYITKNGTRLGVGYEGETDINGIQVLTIDGSSFLEGDEIIFTAYDNTGAIDGTFPLEINDPFIEEIPQAPECITIELAGRDISEENNSLKKLNKNAQTALTFNSTCAEERTIYLHTDLLVTNNNFNIIPNGSEIIDITAKPRNDLLGVYPVQIISVDDATYKTLGVVDIEINDPHNHFTLSDAVFDFKNTQVNTATITNNNYAGRADNFNPQVVLNTESVSVQFTKPGLPEIYDYNLPVRATAIESITLGGTKSEILYSHLSEGNWSSDHTYAKRVEATAVIDSDVASRLCSSVTPEYEEYPKPEPDPPERIRNAIPTYTPSEILSDEGDSSDIIEGELSSKKEKKLLFTTHPGGYISNLRNPAADLEGVFTVNALPLTYGTGDANSTTKLLGSAPTISGNTVTYFWHPKYMDSFGTSTPGPIDTSEVSIFSEQLFGERCTKYNANDPYWRLTPFGNLNDVDKMNWKIISGKETRIVQLAGRVSQSTFLSDSEEYDSDTQFIATGAHENALKKSPVYWKNFVNGDCPTIGNCDDGKIKAQVDSSAAIEFLASIDEETIVPISIKPIEDVVYEVGSYRDFSIAPRWANVDTQFGDYESGDTFIKGNQLYTVGCITSSGIVSWEHAASVGHQNADGCNGMPIRPIIMDPNDPLVEYDSSGNIRYWVHPQDLPEDLNIYLYNGNVFAEYIGVSEVAGNNIDLTLTKNNLIGSEYAIVTVKDWVRNTSGKLEKKHQAFQVKLVGNTHNVYASDGTSGVTGEEFVPKLLFDWEWAHVPSIQCDSENYTYTYCDGVQFNISLFKRLVEIEDLLVKNQLQNIPAKTAFYSYLIKDNYNQALLNDFLEYYESSFLNAGATFSKVKKYIENDKIKFKVNRENNTILPFGGLFRVEIEIIRTNENLYSLFNGLELNSEIIVHLIPIRKAPNYNPFYELPFDGEVGSERGGYGVGANSLLKLREDVFAKEANNALKKINYFSSTNPAVTDTGIVLEYDTSTNDFVLVPSQPTPVEMTVTRDNDRAQLQYSVSGTSANNVPTKTWALRTSTIGDSKCHDFEDQDKQTFTETKTGNNHKISWQRLKNGTLGLTTTFFSSKNSDQPLILTPIDEETNILNSYSIVKQNTSVFLKNYDNRGITNYDTLNGLFNLIKEEKLAINLTENNVKIFWNPEYLAELEDEVISDSGYSCN